MALCLALVSCSPAPERARPASLFPLNFQPVPYIDVLRTFVEHACARVIECFPEGEIQRLSFCVSDTVDEHCREKDCKEMSWAPLESEAWAECLHELRTRPCEEAEGPFPWHCGYMWRRMGAEPISRRGGA